MDSLMVTLRASINDDKKIKQQGAKAKIVALFDHHIQVYLNRKNRIEFGAFSYPILGADLSRRAEIKDADIIYIHWVLGGFLNFRSMRQIAKLGKPVIFFMHDMWNITGGCHHSFTCQKYTEHCYNCQMLVPEREKDRSFKEFEKKLKLYNGFNNLYFVAPSKWLYDCARQSELTRQKPIYYIPNIIDHSFFKPFDKNIAKKILNIDVSEKVIAFGSVSINSPYKGWKFLKESLYLLHNDKNFASNVTVLIFGNGHSQDIAESIPFKIKFMGFLRDEYSTMLSYNAADLFIAPSLADNLPTTILESLSCGTPVVGFDVGGIPDMIKDKENGYLAKYKDAYDIYEGIKFCLENNLKGYLPSEFDEEAILEKHCNLHKMIKNT
ncbi:MAG: glycosyltransferase [Ginsengibacter sp.]|jgi:glycosyltransferase involved in cell wall biosynthesis